jgi:hypothetical protein
MEPEGLLFLCLQAPASGSYRKPDQSNPFLQNSPSFPLYWIVNTVILVIIIVAEIIIMLVWL